MPQEIERKFLVKGDYKQHAASSSRILQGYICRSKERSVRVRLCGQKGCITIKGATTGFSRYEWEKEISEALERSTIAICLVSASFMASDYIMGNELPPLFNKANHNGTKIIPLMVSACGVFEDCWLSKYQAAGSPQKTLSECTDAEVERRLANLMRDLKELIK